MTAEPDLLPCPFCGLDVTDDEGCFPLNRERTRWEVRCGNPSCFAHDPCDESMQAAVARWNRRATAARDAEVEALRELCGMAYQLAGVHDAPEKWLDALSNAAAGRPFSTDGLLPYMPQAVREAEARAALSQQPAAVDEANRSRYMQEMWLDEWISDYDVEMTSDAYAELLAALAAQRREPKS